MGRRRQCYYLINFLSKDSKVMAVAVQEVAANNQLVGNYQARKQSRLYVYAMRRGVGHSASC